MKIKEYKVKGEVRYGFNIYFGKDLLTGKERRTQRRGFKTRREAIEAYSMLSAKGGVEDRSAKTFEDVYNEWKEVYFDTVRETSYIKTIDLFRLHILPAIGSYRIKYIDVSALQKQVTAWRDEGKNYKVYVNYISRVFKYAIHLGLIESNVCEKIYMPKAKTKAKRSSKLSFWSAEELNLFLSIASDEMPLMWYTYFRLLAFTGMRKSEALALEWNDIDFMRNQISVSKTISPTLESPKGISDTKTEAGDRVIDMDPETMKVLKRWKHEQLSVENRISKLVFTNQRGDYVTRSYPIRVLDAFCKKHGLEPISIHGFRHTHCSLLFEAQATIKEVQDRLGHADIKTTMDVYAHVSKAKKKETVDKFVKLLGS